MEASPQLFGDSFSYGWLINLKPSFESLDSSSRRSFDGSSSFIEMDPDFFSMRWTNDAHDFHFNLSSTQSPVLAHADQMFSDGRLLPLQPINTPPPPPPPLLPHRSEVGYESSGSNFGRSKSLDSSKALLSRSNRVQSQHFYAVPSGPVSSNSSPLFHSAQSTPVSGSGKFIKSPFLRNCTKSPKKILWKYLCFLMPLYKKVRGLSLASPGPARSCRDSARGNPSRVTTAFPGIEWRCGNADSSIHDAILHCKKSIGQAS